MAEPVKRRDWRDRANEVRHTREVYSEHLPEGIRAGVLKLVDRVEATEKALAEAMLTISDLQRKLITTEQRLDTIERAILVGADVAIAKAEANKRLGAAA